MVRQFIALIAFVAPLSASADPLTASAWLMRAYVMLQSPAATSIRVPPEKIPLPNCVEAAAAHINCPPPGGAN
jgi:hypothetical protein